ncbi:MBL fold metallo-hydrolase [Candidatus Bathyarchaeota archaeon]|nr:MAG: MBL fold metallo-hydrolase [Candidatus Bathyarchaeota archaeon]
MKVIDDIYLVGGASYNLSTGCNVYLIDCNHELVLIDIGSEADVKLIKENIVEGGFDPRKVSTVLFTHSHLDHAGGAAEAKRNFGCKLGSHVDTAKAIERGIQESQGKLKPAAVEIKLHGGETLTFGDKTIKILSTPGHTREGGDVCYMIECGGKRILFTGDTAFKCERGLMGGHPVSAWLGPRRKEEIEMYLHSLRDLLRLAGPEVLLPGHGLLALKRGREELKRCIEIVSEYLSEFDKH